jgi:hypothetical protein
MIEKIQRDDDKFERMFAVQYLVKYQFEESVAFLKNAMERDPDPEVVKCIRYHLEKRNKL